MELALDVLGMSVVSIVIGLVLTFFGYAVLRFAIALFGALFGFVIGGAIVASMTGEGFLSTAATWIGAAVGAILLGLLAYAFYRVAVLIGLAVMGFAIGAGLVQIFWRESGPEWLIWVVGGGLALLFVVLGIWADLPAFLIIVASSFAGAEIAVSGVMLLSGVVTLAQWQDVGSGIAFENGALWALVTLGVAVVGLVIQLSAWAARRSRGGVGRSRASAAD